MDPTDAELVTEVLRGTVASFEPLVQRHSARLFAMARRYARRESEVEDIVQEIWIKAYTRLAGFRGEAPFEHWLMRLAVHTCYDFLRAHQRNRENAFSEITDPDEDWLDRFAADPGTSSHSGSESAAAAKELVDRLLAKLSPPARLVLTLLEIEGRSVKEISQMTGWSVALVKVRAFRARAEMRKQLKKLDLSRYL